jgi:hypothetical protein
MTRIDRFSLETHEGPYEKWPLRSRLFLDGQPTDVRLPGYQLLDQFETPDGYILITDYDCPFEEATNFALVSKSLRLQSCRTIGWMYETYILERIEWQDELRFIAFIHGGCPWRFTIRSWWIPYIRPRLRRQLLLGQVKAEEGKPAKP